MSDPAQENHQLVSPLTYDIRLGSAINIQILLLGRSVSHTSINRTFLSHIEGRIALSTNIFAVARLFNYFNIVRNNNRLFDATRYSVTCIFIRYVNLRDHDSKNK